MKRIVLWLVLLGLLCPLWAVGLEDGEEDFDWADGDEWIVREGIVYQLEEDCYIPIHFLRGQEVLVLPESVDGLPVHLETLGDLDGYDYARALFAPHGARELRIEAAQVSLPSLYLSGWANLERFSLTTQDWYIDYLSIYDCPRLADFHTEHQDTETSGTFYLEDCPALTSLTVPGGTYEIRGDLSGCDNLRTLVVPGYCYLYEEYISAGTPLESISNVWEDPEDADGVWYSGDQLLLYPSHRPGASYTVKEDTAEIHWDAFTASKYLKTLRLPASLEHLSEWLDVSMLEAIEVDEGNPWLQSIDGVVYSKDGATLAAFPGLYGKAYETPPGTRAVGSAFRYNQKLETLRLGEGLLALDSYVLGNMSALREVHLPASAESIDPDAFWNCTALEAIQTHPDNSHYKSIDGVLFTAAGVLTAFPGGRGGAYTLPEGAALTADFRAGALESLYIPAGVTIQEALRPGNFPALRRIEVAANHPDYTSIDGVLFSKDGKRLVLYPQAHGDVYDVPPGTEVIGRRAFGGNEGLRGVSFPRSLRVIEGSAFSGCTALQSLVLPIGLEEIGDWAFAECLSLEKVIIPRDTGSVGDYILSNCPALRELQGPDEVTGGVRLAGEGYAPAPQYGFVRAEAGASLLAEAQAGAAVMDILPQGAGFSVLSALGEYAQVESGAGRGWLALGDIQCLQMDASGRWNSGDGFVRADTPVYAWPSPEAGVIATLTGNDPMLLTPQGLWCETVVEDGVTGYIDTRMVERLSVAQAGRWTTEVKRMVRCSVPLAPAILRDAPGEDGPETGRLYTGEFVQVLALSGDGVYVRTPERQYGFLRREDTLPVVSFYYEE